MSVTIRVNVTVGRSPDNQPKPMVETGTRATSSMRPMERLTEDADEREAVEGMRRLSLKALESQWDDDGPDVHDV